MISSYSYNDIIHKPTCICWLHLAKDQAGRQGPEPLVSLRGEPKIAAVEKSRVVRQHK